MTTWLRYSLVRASRCIAAVGLASAAPMAWASDLTHQFQTVNIPQQNVCQGQGCAVNTASYAWHTTQWRRWPGTPNVLPSPGRGDRAESVPPKATFDMPAPSARTTPPGPRVQGAGIRAPRPTPAVSRPTPKVDEAPESGIPSTEDSLPPVNLEDILRDDTPAQPKATPEAAPSDNEIPPPFDSKRSGRAPRDSNRTLNALSAGLNGGRSTTKPTTTADPWKAAPVRKVTGEKSAPEGPTLGEPNLMSAPDDGPALQETPDDAADSSALWKPVGEGAIDSDITPAANWEEATDATVDAKDANPLRASSGADGRRSNPLRRR